MVVGICSIEIQLAENHSLKGKRRVIKSINDRLRNNFNVSVAEVDHQDLWQRAILGVACVCSDRQKADQILNKVINFAERQRLAVITNYDIEIISC